MRRVGRRGSISLLLSMLDWISWLMKELIRHRRNVKHCRRPFFFFFFFNLWRLCISNQSPQSRGFLLLLLAVGARTKETDKPGRLLLDLSVLSPRRGVRIPNPDFGDPHAVFLPRNIPLSAPLVLRTTMNKPGSLFPHHPGRPGVPASRKESGAGQGRRPRGSSAPCL